MNFNHLNIGAITMDKQGNLSIVKEFFIFLGERKKFWMIPIVLVLLVLAALIILAANPMIAPFIYTLV